MEGDDKMWKPIVAGSFKPLEVFRADVHYLSKKRKYQDEQGGHLGRKPRLGDESCGSEAYRGGSKTSIEVSEVESDPASSQSESCQDSNSFIEEYHAAIYVDVDSQDRAAYDQHSSSSGDHIDDFNSSLYSLESRTAKRKPGEGPKERHCTEIEDEATFETRKGTSIKQLPGYGMNYHPEFMYSEYGIEDEEQLSGLTAEEMMIYSNDVSPHLYVLSSGTLGINSGDQKAARKPTIDQEFEQYFATLML